MPRGYHYMLNYGVQHAWRTLGCSRLLDPVEQTLEVYGLDDSIKTEASLSLMTSIRQKK